MFLSITTTHPPATDLGFLLHKHPDRWQTFELPFGQAHVYYPEATAARCMAVLLLEVDPIGLVRRRSGPPGEGFALQQYVNDRPYVCSSFMSVAINRVFGSAIAGRCESRAALAAEKLPLEASLGVLPSRGGESLLRRLFEPLGYAVTADRVPLDTTFPDWGESQYYRVRLQANCRLNELLSHLYVLMPVLDDSKHYWITKDEVDKLLHKGAGWLADHPQKELIARRFLKHRPSLARAALAQLVGEESPNLDIAERAEANEEQSIERPMHLHEQRLAAVTAAVQESGAASIMDLGCGEGRLIAGLLKLSGLQRILGMDVSYRVLEIAREKLRLDRAHPRDRAAVELIQGSLVYRDPRLSGFDAACVVEVIEHLDPPRLAAFERVLFEFAHPRVIVVTTPNREHNVLFESLPAGRFRHRDHRFEWTRGEFQSWCERIADRFGYSVRRSGIGPDHPEHGAATQMGVFVAT